MAKKPGDISFLLAAFFLLFVLASAAALDSSMGTGYDRAMYGTAEFPSRMTIGDARTVSIVMRNNGTTAWNSYYSLVPTSLGYSWGVPQGIPAGGSYPPGSEKIFTFNITAPTIVGLYGFQWQMKNAQGSVFQAPNPYLFASICVTPQSGCADTDSVDIYTSGTCGQAGVGCFVDECPGPDRSAVKEWACMRDGCYNTIATCPSGTECSFGKCVPSSSTTATVVAATPTQTPTQAPTSQPAVQTPTYTPTIVTQTPTSVPIPTLAEPSPPSASYTPTPTTTPTTIQECPPSTTNSCCTRTYSTLDGACAPQDTPDNGRCAPYEYCSGTDCVCRSNSCSSHNSRETCASNPGCGWCPGDGKCKKYQEVACQPPGCNGPGLYCADGCGWSQCPNDSPECAKGKCARHEKPAVTSTTAVAVPTAQVTQTTTAPSAVPTLQIPSPAPTPEEGNISMDISWGDWRPISVVAGDKVEITRDLKVRGGTGKPLKIGTAWEKMAKERGDAGWSCNGMDEISVPGKDVEMPMAINCTRRNLITAEQSGWSSETSKNDSNTIFLQHVASDVSVRNTDAEHQYQDVKVEVKCPLSYACPDTKAGNISAGAGYSMRVESSGNSIMLTRTRGSYGGKNYEELDMKDSLGMEHRVVTGWMSLDSGRITGTPSLRVMADAINTSADITPRSKCPSFDSFTINNEAWKSCVNNSGRYEFVAPRIAEAPVKVRLVGGEDAVPASGDAAKKSPVESIDVSYPQAAVMQGSNSAVLSGPPSLRPSASLENVYVNSVESISGVPVATDPSAREALEKETAKASSVMKMERVIEPSPEKSSVKVTVENKGTDTLKNVVVFETIPKSVAQSADEINAWKVNGKPATPKIVENDPVLAIVFEAVPAGEVQTIEYEVKKEVQSSGAKEYSAPVVLAYAMAEGLKEGGTGAFSFIGVFQKWVGGWIFWLIVTFFSAVVLGSYLAYRWVKSKTE